MLAGCDGFQAKGRVGCWRCGNNDRIDMWQGLLDVPIGGDSVLDLVFPAVDTSEPLVHGDDLGDSSRGPEHPDVPRAPIADTHNTDTDLLRSHRRFPLPVLCQAAL